VSHGQASKQRSVRLSHGSALLFPLGVIRFGQTGGDDAVEVTRHYVLIVRRQKIEGQPRQSDC
jgi:hypothetical protein